MSEKSARHRIYSPKVRIKIVLHRDRQTDIKRYRAYTGWEPKTANIQEIVIVVHKYADFSYDTYKEQSIFWSLKHQPKGLGL